MPSSKHQSLVVCSMRKIVVVVVILALHRIGRNRILLIVMLTSRSSIVGFLSDNYPKWAQFNAVVILSDNNGRGGGFEPTTSAAAVTPLFQELLVSSFYYVIELWFRVSVSCSKPSDRYGSSWRVSNANFAPVLLWCISYGFLLWILEERWTGSW